MATAAALQGHQPSSCPSTPAAARAADGAAPGAVGWPPVSGYGGHVLGMAFTHGGTWRDMAASTRPADKLDPAASFPAARRGASGRGGTARVVVGDLPPLPRRAHPPLRELKLGNWPSAWRLRGH